MGRFFQTARPEFVDNKILQLPYQLVGQVINKVDSDIQKNESALLSLYDRLNVNSLKQDQPRARQIINKYEGDIDSLAQQIQQDPLQFRKKTSDIRNLSRTIGDDLNRGELSAIQGNFNSFQNFLQTGQEAVKKGDILQEDFTFAKNKFISDFQGTNFNNGTFDSIYTEDLNNFINVENIAEERGQKYAANVAEQVNGFSDGVYIYEDETKQKVLSYDKIYSGVLSSLINDKELNDYLTQQVRLGKLDQQSYNDTIIKAAERVANKFSFSETKRSRKLKNDQIYLENLRQRNKKDFAKFKKELDKKEEEQVFTPVFNRTSALLPKDKFNYENIISFSSSLKDEVDNLKRKDITNFSPQELRNHQYNVDKKQAALNRINSIKDKAVDGTMRRIRDEGIISQEDYSNFLEYQKDKENIDNLVIPKIEFVKDQVQKLLKEQPELQAQAIAGALPFSDEKDRKKFQSSIQNNIVGQVLRPLFEQNPGLKEAFEKYNAGRVPFRELNKGEKIQITDGFNIEIEEPNRYLNKWFKENADSNALFNSVISLDTDNKEDQQFISVLDDIAVFNSADTKVLSTTRNNFNSDGSINTKELNLELEDDGFFATNDRFSINNILEKTGKKPSEIFDVKGIEPSINGVRVIYEYDEDKVKENGIDGIEGLQNKQRFILEYPNSGIEQLIKDRYSKDKNYKAAEISRAFGNPVYMHISNEVDRVIKDITADNFQQGPQNNLFIDGIRLNLSATKNPNGGFLYNVTGRDNTNGKEFSIDSIPSSDQLKFYIKNYLDVRNSNKLE